MEAIDADFSKTYLFPPAIEDFVPPDHPARFIREFAEYALSEVKIEWKESSGIGRPPYAAGLLLRVVVGHDGVQPENPFCEMEKRGSRPLSSASAI